MKGNKLVKFCLIFALAGLMITGIGAMLGGRVYGLSLGPDGLDVHSNLKQKDGRQVNYVDENKELQPFKNLDMNINFAEITIKESDHYGIEYHIREERKIIEEQKGDTLKIKQKRSNGNITLFSIGEISLGDTGDHEYVTIFVPKGAEFDRVGLNNDSGDITIDDIQAKDLTIDSSFGKITTKKIVAGGVKIDSDSGDIKSDAVVADDLTLNDSFGAISIGQIKLSNKLKADVDSGDIHFDSVEAADINMNTSFGKIKCGEITAENVVLDSDSGDCIIDNLSAGSVQAKTSFGSIKVGLRESVEGYTADVSTEFGSITVNHDDMGEKYKNKSSDGTRNLVMDCDSGDITLYDVK